MKKKLKGLLSLWLAVVLVLGTPTVPILAEEVSHSGHPDIGVDGRKYLIHMKVGLKVNISFVVDVLLEMEKLRSTQTQQFVLMGRN